MSSGSGDSQENRSARQHRDYADQRLSYRTASGRPVPRVTHALNEQQVKRSRGRREIVGISPGLDRECGQHGGAYEKRQTHLALANDTGKPEQRQRQKRTQIELPPGNELSRTAT